ncbi:MAG: heme-binding protein [Terricaulis sp.]
MKRTIFLPPQAGEVALAKRETKGAALRLLAIAALACAAFTPSAIAQPNAHAPYGAPIQLAAAERIVDAAQAEAEANNLAVAIAVVDSGGRLVSFRRMDGVGTAVIDIAIGKAYTASSMRQPSENLQGWASSSSAPVAIPGIMPFGGGIPLEVDGRIVGAIGVSGESTENDLRVANAGVAALR